jgi:Zn-dependent metalloprotease
MGVAGAIPGYVLIRAAAVGVAVSTGPLPADSSRNPLRRLILDATGVRRAKEGRPVRREGDPPVDDPAVNAVYDNLEICHRFLWDVFGRDSYDDQGAQLTAAVHYGDGLADAFWDGELMVFGDGDGEVFGDLAGALDIAALSVGRAINQFEAGLVYHGQDGAIVESFGDVVAALVVQYHENQTADQAHWLVGRVLGPKARGDALRSMKAPGTAYDSEVLGRDRQPAHMRDYVETEEDNGGVHINSGILNHAFYLVAISLGGRAWEQAGRIWYDAMCAAQATEIRFAGFAALTVAAATSRYGADGLEVAAVRDAWDVVGVDSGTPARGAG